MTAPDRIWQRLMRGIDFIESHIEEDLTLARIASMAALSDYHFHRLFRTRFGVPVIDYVRRRRITRAAAALLEARTSILQIALDAGFDSQAAFSRAFRRIYHVSPARYRNRGRDVPWLSSAPISDAVISMFPGLGKAQPWLEEIQSFEVAGLEAQFDEQTRKAIPDLWAELAGIVGAERLATFDSVGISENDEAVLGGELGYMASVRLSPGQIASSELATRAVAGGSYLVFTFRGSFHDIAKAYDYIFGIWMPGARQQLAPAPSFSLISPRARAAYGDGNSGTAQIWIPVLSQ